MGKRTILSGAVLAAAVLCSAPRAQAAVAVGITVGATVETATFHARLAPYGRWVATPVYGQVWVPYRTYAGWRPYADGRWVLTEYGWTFVSDDPYGWATYHYGNWVVVDSIGWVWVPGRVWAPAWVSWRYGGGYAAWAPLPPVGYRVAYYSYSSPAWVVVQQQHFTQPVRAYAVSGAVTASAVARAQPLAAPVAAGGVMVNPGPRPAAISQAVGRPLSAVSARAVVAGGTRAIAAAPRAPAAPLPVSQALGQRWSQQKAAAGNGGSGAARMARPRQGGSGPARMARPQQGGSGPAQRSFGRAQRGAQTPRATPGQRRYQAHRYSPGHAQGRPATRGNPGHGWRWNQR